MVDATWRTLAYRLVSEAPSLISDQSEAQAVDVELRRAIPGAEKRLARNLEGIVRRHPVLRPWFEENRPDRTPPPINEPTAPTSPDEQPPDQHSPDQHSRHERPPHEHATAAAPKHRTWTSRRLFLRRRKP